MNHNIIPAVHSVNRRAGFFADFSAPARAASRARFDAWHADGGVRLSPWLSVGGRSGLCAISPSDRSDRSDDAPSARAAACMLRQRLLKTSVVKKTRSIRQVRGAAAVKPAKNRVRHLIFAAKTVIFVMQLRYWDLTWRDR